VTAPSIPAPIRTLVADQAGQRCGYCLTRQEYVPWPLEIEHIIPVAKGGGNEIENLWLACRSCNSFKGVQIDGIDPFTGRRIPLFHPRSQKWSEHFAWNESGDLIIGLTPTGRATIIALQMNNLVAVTVRRNWIAAGWHPPQA